MSEPGSPSGPALPELAQRVDEAIAGISALEPEARSRAEAVKAAIEGFHRPALVAIVQALRADPRGKEILFDLVDDPAVRAVLSLHGIIKPPPAPEPAPTSPCDQPSGESFIPLAAVGRRRPGS